MTEERLDACDLLCLDLPKAEEIRRHLPAFEVLEPAARTAKGLADPTRLNIAAALAAGGELCVCDMAWIVGQPQNLVSHHLRQLRTAGLASSRRDGRLVMYGLTEQGRFLVRVLLGDAVSTEI